MYYIRVSDVTMCCIIYIFSVVSDVLYTMCSIIYIFSVVSDDVLYTDVFYYLHLFSSV